MKKAITMIIIGLSLVFVGGIIFIIGGSIIFKTNGGFDISKREMKTVEIVEDFKNINVDLITYDVSLRPSQDGKTKIEYTETQKEKCNVVVSDSVLKITYKDDRKWFEKFFSFGGKSLTIYLPEKEYENLNIDITTGDLKLNSKATFKNATICSTTGDVEGSLKVLNDFNIKVTTGDIELSNINCENFSIVGTSSDIELIKVIASETFKIKVTTGDVEFSSCDSKNIEINGTTGDVVGTLLSGKTFTVSTITGEKILPQNSDGGICKINVTTGDVKIKLTNN